MTKFKDEIDYDAFELEDYPVYCEVCHVRNTKVDCGECPWYLRRVKAAKDEGKGETK